MKFIVIYGKIKNEKQNIGYINHSRNKIKNPLRFTDVISKVKNI